MSSLEAKKQMLHQQDQRDVVQHNKRVAELRDLDVFEKMADLLSNAGGVHVDMSAYLGSLAEPLMKRFENLHILAVQRNPEAARMFTKIIEKHESRIGGPIERYQSIRQSFAEENGKVRRAFHPPHNELLGMDFGDLNPSLWVVADEMDTMHVTSEILGKRKIDSASLNFPMYNFVRTMEAPFDCSFVSNIEVWRRLEQIIHGELRAAYRFATERVKTGGKLIVGLDTMEQDRATIVSSTRNLLMQHCSACWEDDGYESTFLPSQKKTASLLRFVRNERPFS